MGLIFASHETLAQLNEKARRRGMSYGKYVQARYNGQFQEDAQQKLDLRYEARQAYLSSRRRPR